MGTNIRERTNFEKTFIHKFLYKKITDWGFESDIIFLIEEMFYFINQENIMPCLLYLFLAFFFSAFVTLLFLFKTFVYNRFKAFCVVAFIFWPLLFLLFVFRDLLVSCYVVSAFFDHYENGLIYISFVANIHVPFLILIYSVYFKYEQGFNVVSLSIFMFLVVLSANVNPFSMKKRHWQCFMVLLVSHVLTFNFLIIVMRRVFLK